MAVGFKLQRPADDKGSKLVVGFAFEGVELVRLLVCRLESVDSESLHR